MQRPDTASALTATAGQPYGDDVAVGDEMTPLEVTPDVTQMFFFSAATYNGHRIHYDTGWACDKEGYPAVLVQGPLQSALLARAVTDWMGPRGRAEVVLGAEPGVRLSGRPLGVPGDDHRHRARRVRGDRAVGAAR